jgi:hypothetical protein
MVIKHRPRSRSRSRRRASSPIDNSESHRNDTSSQEPVNVVAPDADDDPEEPHQNAGDGDALPQRRSVPAHVRERQRRVAEREASRLARPEVRPAKNFLGHANRQKAAVTSTPFGTFFASSSSKQHAENEEWCGPFSVARQMIAQREEARRKREEEQAGQQQHHPLDDVMVELDYERKRKAHPSLTWKSQMNATASTTKSSSSLYAKRKRRVELSRSSSEKVPTLFQLCVNYVVNNFDHVESLGNVGSSIRNAIAHELVAKQQLDGIALDALLEDGMESLELIDASNISQEQMSVVLQRLVPLGLRYLSLQHAGKCFGQKTVQAILAAATATSTSLARAKSSISTPNNDNSLFALSIGGAYLLKDADAAALLRAMAPTLSSLEFTACPFLGPEFCQALASSYHTTTGNLVELSLEFLPLSATNVSILSTASHTWRHLKTLSLKRMEGLTDEHVAQWLEPAGNTLEHLDLSYNVHLTDDILSSIRRHNPHLRSLLLCGLKSLTSAGLETFFTMEIDGFPHPPPMLRTLKLACCDHEAVTDEVLEKAALASSRKLGSGGSHPATRLPPAHDHDDTIDEYPSFQKSVISTLGGLVDVDVRGARHITDTALEVLVTTSSTSLKTLNVSFCSFVTDQGLGYLVSKTGVQLKRIEIWGCCQITDEFLDGHSRIDDGSLEIVGAWMKKSGMGSLRL